MRAKLFLVVILFSLASGAARAAEPWDTPFASDTRAQIKAARDIPVPDDQGVVILLEQHKYVIDENGRTVFTIRKVYRILKEDAIEDWSSIEQEYQPWHQSKPELRARVITEDGAVHWLDPKTIGDSPSTEYDANIFSDRRVARAPLPAIKPGAVIEYEIIVRETSPLLDAGEVRRITINDGIPIQRFRLSIEAPSSVALKTIAGVIPESAIRRSSSGGKTQFECDWGPLAPRKKFEGNLPSDVPNFPYVAFSTGKSWQEIASRYETIVDQQIRTGDVNALLQGLDRTGSTLEIATRLAARLHKEIRYTGVEFGESEIVPHTPDETQKRKYGDCKDKASLLVAMLRAAGLRASVALLDAGFDTDANSELPGLGLFNHAIVFVEAEPPLWIDATSAETRVGQLPSMDQGRLALVASKHTTSLVLTPESSSSDNVRTDTIEFLLSDFGPGELHETIQAQGSLETRMRQMYDGDDEKKVKESLERYLKRDYLAKSIGQFKVTKKDDFSESFHLLVEGREVKRALTEENDAVAVLSPSLVFQELPYTLTHKMDGASEGKEEEIRKNDFVFNEPHVIELRYKIHPPAFFKVKDLPASRDLKLGTAAYTRKYQTNPDGTVDVLFRLDTGKRRLSPAEFTQLRLVLREVYAASPEVLTFVSEASEYVALGETRKAIKLVSAGGSGQAGPSQVRLSRMLVTAGAVNSAIRVARKIVEQDPASQQGWQSLAWAYQHDHFGRLFRGDWNAAEAEKCYREALKLDPDDFMAKINLAILLQYDANGLMYGKGSRLDESVQLYREILKTMPNPGVQQNVAVALLYAGHYAEAKEEVTKLPDTELHYVLLAVLTALTDNSARAIIDSQTRIPDQRARVAILVGAGQTLGQLRQYDRALDLLKAAARLSNSHELQAQLDFLARMKRYDQSLVPETDPLYPVQQVLLEIYSTEFNFDSLKAQFTKREDWAPLRESILKLRQRVQAWRAMMTSQGLGPESILDAALSTQDFAKSPGAENPGEETHGFRFSGSSPVGPMPVMYVVRESGKYRILGMSKNPEEVGRRVLNLLSEKDVKGAQWWLDKVVPDLQPDRSDGAGGPAARFLWSGVTPETRGPEAISLAAASLIGPHTGSEQAIQTLREARAKASVQLVKAQMDLALCESLERAGKWDELMATARRLAGIHLFEKDGFRFIVKAATAQERWKELQAEAAQRAKSARQDSEALEALIISAIHNGDEGAAAASFTQLAQLPYAGPEELEFEAWASMLSGKPDADVLAKLGKNSELPELSTPAFWYALGMLQAAMNKPEEAQRSLAKALEQEDWETLDAKPWALAGKIYQQYGLEEEAAEAIAKARASATSDESAKWALSIVLPAAMVQAGKTVPGSKVH
jgi:tetratricopeptide (TPR) repeat protein